MAKKAAGKVAGSASKNRTQLIIPVRSEKTGAYGFKNFFVDVSEVPALIARYKK